MAKTVIGLFDNFADARAVVADLERSGFDRDQVSIIGREGERTTTGAAETESHSGSGAAAGAGTGAVVGGAAGLLAGLAGLTIPVIGPVLGAGWLAATLAGAGVGAAAGGLVGALVGAGVPKEHAEYYHEGVKRGGTLVTVRCDDARAEAAAEIMNRHGVVDIEERAAQWRSGTGTTATSGAQRMSETAETARPARPAQPAQPARRAATAGSQAAGEQKLEVVEENLKVGKRQVQGGGVRVYAHVTEKPVQEQVTLRQERVEFERRPVNRPATPADVNAAAAFKDQTIEVTERREEAVVQKEARVVEEVVVRKDVEQKTETVRDTVRRRDVEVEKVNPDAGPMGTAGASRPGFDAYDAEFRKNHATAFASSGFNYDDSRPLYEHTYQFAHDQRYAKSDWNSVEPDIRRRWEERHPNSWDRVKGIARSVWDRSRQATR